MGFGLGLGLGLSSRLEVAGGAPPITPATIMGANTVEWWRSDLGITIGTGVSAWHGQVLGADLLQATGGAQPTYNAAGGPNGTPSLQFDGVDDDLRNATIARAAPGTTPAVIWAIVRQLAWTSTEQIFADASANAFSLRQVTGSPTVNQNNAANANSNAAAVINTWVRLQAHFSNSVNDRLLIIATAVTGASAGNNAGTGPRIAVNPGAGTLWANIELCELALFNANPAGAQITALDAYVTSRYGAGLV